MHFAQEGSHFGSSHLCSNGSLLLRGPSVLICLFLLISSQRCAMPKGWSKAPVLDGWVQILRGPRPKADRWPKASVQPRQVPPKRSQSAVSGGSARPSERDGVLLQRHRSRPPEEVAAEASSEVHRLEGTIAALGESNPLCAPLKDALRIVRAKSKVLPVKERVEACKGFIERAKKRLTRTEAVISRAHEQKSIFEAAVRDGEARLLQLQAELDAQPEPVGPSPSVAELQRQIDQLVQERDALKVHPRQLPGVWMADGAPMASKDVPPMPGDRQDLEGWLSCRNCELRNALEFGDTAAVARVGALVGSAKMAAFVPDVPMDGQAKSSLMSALIDQADAKRRCIDTTQIDGSQV